MNRFVMRHPLLGGPALIPESSMPLHKAQGWLRVSDVIPEHSMDQVNLATYANALDLDAEPEPTQEPATAAKPTKEK